MTADTLVQLCVMVAVFHEDHMMFIHCYLIYINSFSLEIIKSEILWLNGVWFLFL